MSALPTRPSGHAAEETRSPLVTTHRRRRGWMSLGTALAVVLGGLTGLAAPAAYAASVTSAVFTGGTGTVSNAGTVFAKNGGALTLTVATSSDTQCVDVTGAFTGHQQSGSGKTSWVFAISAGGGDGAQTITASASPGYNGQGKCTGATQTGTASYTLDNTGPDVAAALSPAANAAGWTNATTTVTWTASDAGSGVASGPTPASSTESANGIVTRTATAKDKLGNSGSGSVTVRVDRARPTITASQTKNTDGTTTVTFVCDDSNSGGGEPSGIASCLADGTTTNSKIAQPGTTVTGTAIDRAGNRSTASSTAPAGDTTAPTLTGSPTTSANGNGWYSGDVTVRWSAADPESGIPTAPADTIIKGEGTALTSTTSATNGAGLTTTATSSPAVKIDRTAPTTGISGTSNSWSNGKVTVSLSAGDNLSGVATTEYSIDGGAVQSGTSVTLAADGAHTVTFRSTDMAGNVETDQVAHVRIDQTAPTIGHTFTPLSYTDGTWVNQNVTVTFTCADQGGSNVAGCTTPQTANAEGSTTLIGTATDGAGNSATDQASVRIDKTAPTITALVTGDKNDAGWYNHDVTVSYTANDALSGVSGAPAPKTLGEGANQGASASATDAAGNTASASVSGINVDTTPPVLSAHIESGWHTGDVAVAWSCTDALSGVAAQPADDTITGEGSGLSSTASCTDVAGNTAVKTVDGITIDRTAPTTSADVEKTAASGWHAAAVQVTLKASDSLSGVASTFYAVDGGTAETYAGVFSFATEGEHSISFWSVDLAGNVETAGPPLVLKIDTTAPQTTVVNPISPDSGWFVQSGIPVAFTATDAGSGIAATYYAIDGGETQTYGEAFTADLSTGTHTITYWSVDLAGNGEAHETTNTIAVNVDTDAPTIVGTASPTANANGWNNTAVDVTFSCDDIGSGIQTGVAGCAGDTTLTNEGAAQSVHGDAVDVAGNTGSSDVDGINIDTTKPTLVGVPADGNGAGWHTGDVTVKWVGDDALSGIDPATQPGDSVIKGEGVNLGAGPVSIRDKAGNTSDDASVSGVKIDRTAPNVTGAPTTQPNGAGWYKDGVAVDFTCTDTLSGVASCPTTKVIRGDGANQSVTSDRATDIAGNSSAGTTVSGINIDGTAPTSSSNNTCTASNGYCTGDTADVVLNAVDQAGLSGVKEIRYSIDGAAERVAVGATTTVSVPLTGSGSGSVKYYAVDNAGNVESANAVALKWDNIAPTVSHTLSPAANADDWNNANVTVTFTAKDDDKGSGVANVSAPVTVSTETPGQLVSGAAKDTAGNVGTDTVTVKLDKTAPSISGAITSGTKSASGWYTGPVTVTFTCADGLSGVATCPDPIVLSANGANAASGTVSDKAGNTATAKVDGINIDQEKPTLTTADINVQGKQYTLGAVPAATCTATDSFSGLASCTVTVTGGNANGVGTFNSTATATDIAGNTATLTATYSVIYRFDGFLQPINDTAHQTGVSTSVFKAGSTVPAKFQLKNSAGTLVKGVAAASWATPVKGSAMTAPVDETVYPVSADSGSAFKYDATAQQYLYNWKTGSTGGNYWRIAVTLDDGQTYYVNIGLR